MLFLVNIVTEKVWTVKWRTAKPQFLYFNLCQSVKLDSLSCSFTSRLYPYTWRHSFIIPLHKSGNTNDLNIYRGISLQNCIAILFSSTLNKRLMTPYEDLFYKHQFGFRGNHRTSDSRFILKTLITKYVLNKKKKIYSCFIDLRKACDTLWHSGLLYKPLTNNVGCTFFNVIQNI
jgi:hypothetical protein